jgi:hypothetical protein
VLLSGKVATAAITIAHGLAGWALCGVTIGLARKATTLETALIMHAIAAPLIFVVLSLLYLRRPDSWPPLVTASAFLATVLILDAFVIAPLIERSFEMFTSILGTWLPFLLIFLATWCTGVAARRTRQ